MKREAKEIAKQAKKNGICSDWHKELKTLNSIDELAEMYLKGIDFCLSNDFPTNEYLRANFKGKMEKHGIHLDETFGCRNKPKVVALGACNAHVKVDEYQVSEVFVKHKSKMSLTASGHAFVMVDAFDDTEVKVWVHDSARVAINRYGNAKITTMQVNDSAYLKIIEKNKKTY